MDQFRWGWLLPLTDQWEKSLQANYKTLRYSHNFVSNTVMPKMLCHNPSLCVVNKDTRILQLQKKEKKVPIKACFLL